MRLAKKEGCFGCCQSITSTNLAICSTLQGNSSGIGGGKFHNRLYALQDRLYQEGSPDVLTGTL